MSPVVPAYPLYPIACIFASLGLLLVLLTNFVRQSWNTGIALLCSVLFVVDVASVANMVIWSDNGDVKLHMYCDIGEHDATLRSR